MSKPRWFFWLLLPVLCFTAAADAAAPRKLVSVCSAKTEFNDLLYLLGAPHSKSGGLCDFSTLEEALTQAGQEEILLRK